jgi:hypothetical protein
VHVGEFKGQGIKVASRAVIDTTTDTYASASFKNVFGINIGISLCCSNDFRMLLRMNPFILFIVISDYHEHVRSVFTIMTTTSSWLQGLTGQSALTNQYRKVQEQIMLHPRTYHELDSQYQVPEEKAVPPR